MNNNSKEKLAMSTLVRWNPNRSLFSEFDRFFQTTPYLRRQAMTEWSLALDVADSEDGYIVEASVPGINPDDLEITLEDNVLTINTTSVSAALAVSAAPFASRSMSMPMASRRPTSMAS
jgi:HSP20 family molecular chaperone IbpA